MKWSAISYISEVRKVFKKPLGFYKDQYLIIILFRSGNSIIIEAILQFL
jgi:hypothetical protein